MPGQFRSAYRPRSKQKFRIRCSDKKYVGQNTRVGLYACYLYTCIRLTCIYALERFMLNIFCVNKRKLHTLIL